MLHVTDNENLNVGSDDKVMLMARLSEKPHF